MFKWLTTLLLIFSTIGCTGPCTSYGCKAYSIYSGELIKIFHQ